MKRVLSFNPNNMNSLSTGISPGKLSGLIVILSLFLIPKLSAQKKDVNVVCECVEYVGNGKFKASFGYENQNKEDITVTQSNSQVTTNSGKSNGWKTFKQGRQYNVFTKDFYSRDVVVWTVILPNGKQKRVTASANSNHCKPRDNGNIFPYYPPPAAGKNTTIIGSELSSLYNRYLTDTTAQLQSDHVYQIQNGNVLVEIIAHHDYITSLRSLLSSSTYGLTNEIADATSRTTLVGFFPIRNLAKLNELTSQIKFARPIYLPIASKGIVTTQGDKAQRSDIARYGFGVDGTGIKIGVVSDGYNTRVGNEAATDIANGDLPTGIDIVKEYPYGRVTDEGRAMMQIVHDVAPGAKLAFRTGFLSAGDLALGIKELKNKGCDVIVDDITFITEPYLTDGKVAAAVDEVAAQGVSYFSAAGNCGTKSYQKTFAPMSAPSGFTGNAHNFGSGDAFQRVSLTPGDYTLVLQWQDNIYSLNPGSGGAQNDFDIYLTNTSGQILFGFNRDNRGGDPIEVLPFTVENTNASANIVIVRAAGSQNALLKYIVFRGDMVVAEYNTASSTIVGHANATGAMAVGAVLSNGSIVFICGWHTGKWRR